MKSDERRKKVEFNGFDSNGLFNSVIDFDKRLDLKESSHQTDLIVVFRAGF